MINNINYMVLFKRLLIPIMIVLSFLFYKLLVKAHQDKPLKDIPIKEVAEKLAD